MTTNDPMPPVDIITAIGTCAEEDAIFVLLDPDGWCMNGRCPQSRPMTEAEARALARELVRAADLLRAEDY